MVLAVLPICTVLSNRAIMPKKKKKEKEKHHIKYNARVMNSNIVQQDARQCSGVQQIRKQRVPLSCSIPTRTLVATTTTSASVRPQTWAP